MATVQGQIADSIGSNLTKTLVPELSWGAESFSGGDRASFASFAWGELNCLEHLQAAQRENSTLGNIAGSLVVRTRDFGTRPTMFLNFQLEGQPFLQWNLKIPGNQSENS
jgi:hypothetical protein